MSAAPKHTPGPWMRRDAADYAEIVAPDGTVVAMVGHERDADPIAAAPELFKHVRSLLNGIDTGLVRLSTDADETLATTMRGLRAAVAKVEGR